ncbi:MAG: hypothetical protein JWM87_1796 [Candidatus Eremiobacteraeota bacterium]|nr:hypothetical protein [Candidatus Eremiobacteraeota bacterium]
MPQGKLPPGTPAPISGEYRPQYPNGKRGPEVTAVQGKPLPPTKVPGSTYVPVRPAHNGAGKPKK